MPTIDGTVTQALPFLAPGSPAKAVFDRLNGMGISKFGPDYLAANLAGYLFSASGQAGVALTTTLSTTATGFILSNAPGSNRVLVPLFARFAITSAGAGVCSIGWGLSYHASTLVTHTTPLIVRSGIVNDIAAVSAPQWAGQADRDATLPVTPVAIDAVSGGPVATGGITYSVPDQQFNGSLILMPGASMATFVLTTAISALISMKWLSLPLPV